MVCPALCRTYVPFTLKNRWACLGQNLIIPSKMFWLIAGIVGALCFPLACGVSTFTNPLKNPNGSDPFIVHDSGFYYMTTTTWNNVQLTRATTIGGLKTAAPVTVYSTTTASRCCNVWAPEIHKIGGMYVFLLILFATLDYVLSSHISAGTYILLQERVLIWEVNERTFCKVCAHNDISPAASIKSR